MKLSQAEKEVLFKFLRSDVMCMTLAEAEGVLTPAGIDNAALLRGIFVRLLKDVNKTQSLHQVEALLLGLDDLVSEGTLRRYTKVTRGDVEDRMLFIRARYMLDQRRLLAKVRKS